MDAIFENYWAQLVALVAYVFWLGRLEAVVRSQAGVIADLRREQIEINRRAQDQAITLAAINESLSAIKITLDRLYERIERRA